MKKAFKYVLLVLFAALASIGIYEYIEANKPIEVEGDILTYQDSIEKTFLADTNYTIDNPKVILNPYGNSPLTALIIFETNDLTTPTITIKGKNGSDDITHTFIPGKVHILPVYGLYADYNNEVVINVSEKSKTIHIQTEALPENLTNIENVANDLETDEFYFTTPENKNYTVAYDSNGDVRWYLTGDYKWEIQRLNNGHLLISSDKLVNLPYYTKGLLEIDLLGKIYYQYDIPNGYHHSVIELPNSNFLVASNNFKDGTTEDYIVEIDRNSGEIIKEINLHKLQNNDQENWLGLNSLHYDSKTNSITFAGENNNMIANIDYNSEEINYIIADKENVPEKYQKYILNTEDIIMPNKPQSLKILNDGTLAFINTKDDGIYLTMYSISDDKKKVLMVSEEKLDDEKLTASINITDENHYVLTAGSYFKEQNDDESLKIETNTNLYNTAKLSLYANDIYTTGAGTKLGSLGITETTKDISVIFHKTDDSIIEKYDLKFVKEADRLVVTGTFKKSDDVQIILDNFLTKRTYDMVISDTPYKGKDSNDKVTVSKYINDDDIYGKFYLYIRINGVNYKLWKYVTF